MIAAPDNPRTTSMTPNKPLPAAPPASAETLSERVGEQLRHQITQGELVPGQRLSEQAFSDSLGVSRNTLREAFRALAKDGLVKHEHNRGVFVATPDLASIIDIYRVRRLIECQALAQAYPRHPAKKKMRAAIDKALRQRDAQDWAGVGTANMEFHMAIVELADSERLNSMFAPVLAELRLAFGLIQDAEFLHAPYVDMNVKILELAEAGEYAKAAAALQDYLAHAERIILAVYARRSAASG
jgi:DNA-binding GntR family transcriptional regulator